MTPLWSGARRLADPEDPPLDAPPAAATLVAPLEAAAGPARASAASPAAPPADGAPAAPQRPCAAAETAAATAAALSAAGGCPAPQGAAELPRPAGAETPGAGGPGEAAESRRSGVLGPPLSSARPASASPAPEHGPPEAGRPRVQGPESPELPRCDFDFFREDAQRRAGPVQLSLAYLARQWRQLPKGGRARFAAMADVDKARFEREYEVWSARHSEDSPLVPPTREEVLAQKAAELEELLGGLTGPGEADSKKAALPADFPRRWRSAYALFCQ
ncbi:unnamed protein product, partial [Prorocentrum cordatum]